jgi:endonuclease YncB( thermonuclease family)
MKRRPLKPHGPNVIPFKRRKRRMRLNTSWLLIGILIAVALAFTAYEQSQQSSTPAVTAFSPGTDNPYSRKVPASSAETTVAQRGPGAYRVIDGDTIEAPYGVKYRLLRYDTPETYFSKCDEELALGRKATERLKELLASGEVRIIETGKTGKYGRSLAYLHVNGRDVGKIMIGEGLARPYDGGRREGWCG